MANLSTANSVQCEVARRKNSVESTGSKRRLTSTLRREKTWSTDTVALGFFWLPNCFTALGRVYIDARQIDCVQWLELETMRAGGRAGHSLCPLGSCKEDELCPHAVHMALRVEDGMERDAPNARAG